MLEFIIPKNPDDRILKKAKDFLDDSKIVVFPTDTNWVFTVDPFSRKAVEGLYKLKGLDFKRPSSLLCKDISQASEFAVISNAAFCKIRSCVPGHYTFIFPSTKKIPRPMREFKRNKEIGIRIPDSKICLKLIEFFGKPLLTSSLKILKTRSEDNNEVSLREFYSIDIENTYSQVALILDPGDYEFLGPSSIIDYSEDMNVGKIIRVGAGDVTPFL